MNREQKRSMIKQKGGDGGVMQTPCSITEAVQISRASAEDVVSDYHRKQSHLQIAITLQIEILKEVVISAGLLTEEEFRKKYMEKAEEFNRLQQESMSEEDAGEKTNDSPKMEIKSDDIEISKSEK